MTKILNHLIVFFLFTCIWSNLNAEGTRELAPNPNINIDGTIINDIAALHLDNAEFNFFGSFDNPNEQGRLFIHVANPDQEGIFLGFSNPHLNLNNANPIDIEFIYRVLDPNGNVVYGPIRVLPNEAGPGIIESWNEAVNGPTQLGNANGYTALEITPADLTSQGWSGKGDYYIEFDAIDNDEFLIDYWDISVADVSNAAPIEKKGRVWSFSWALFAINDFGFPNRPFNGSFYVCAPDVSDPDAAYITKIDFNNSGFRPAAFNIAFNSFGVTESGIISEDRKSFEGGNLTKAEYPIFLNDPVDICKTATIGELDFNGVARCDADSFCINIQSDKAGQVDIILDFDGEDDVYTPNTRDVLLSIDIDQSQINQPICIDWDGLDGLGNRLPEDASSRIPVFLSYSQGIYHFPVYDAELMTNGFQIESVRPTGPEPLLYYDDSNISVPSGSGEPAVQLAGCVLPCHRWTNYTQPNTVGFGNLCTINSWWFSQQTITKDVFNLPGYFTCEVEGPDVICDNQEAVLMASVEVTPFNTVAGDLFQINWSGPSITSTPSGVEVTVDEPGVYEATLFVVNQVRDSCFYTCTKSIEVLPASESTIDTTLVAGDILEINGESYSQEGVFMQTLLASNGCDSILTINLQFEAIPFEASCNITGPRTNCLTDTSALNLTFRVEPPEAIFPDIESISWTGPGIASGQDDNILFHTGGGVYMATFTYFDVDGILQERSCEYEVEELPISFSQIDTSMFLGETLTINGQTFNQEGIFNQVLTNSFGCDSTVTIVLNVNEPLYQCDISGPNTICEDATGTLNLSSFVSPPGAPIPPVSSVEWTGPGLIQSQGFSVNVNEPGDYTANLNWINAIGEARSTTCSFSVGLETASEETIQLTIVEGDVILVNGQAIDAEGTYVQELVASNGCDSILTINVTEEFSIVSYDLDDCQSVDYSKFTPAYPNELSCGVVVGNHVYRNNPSVNAHSCTPGVDGAAALCIDASEDCTFNADDDKALRFDIHLFPHPGEEINITGLRFFEQAPNDFQWIVGTTGPNNFPTRYGIRILSNGSEIFRQEDIPTDFNWSQEDFNFVGLSGFTITEETILSFELLPYCLVGKDADVSVWDVDNISLRGTCINGASRSLLSGTLFNADNMHIPFAEVELRFGTLSHQVSTVESDIDGNYAFVNLPSNKDYILSASKRDDYLNGVSTLDLVMIQRHILNSDRFENPYDYLAADINNDQKISVIDLIELRKLILGIYDALPNNDSWKFGAPYQELGIDNPWRFKEDVWARDVAQEERKDLMGIKIGDVSHNASFEDVQKRSTDKAKVDVIKHVLPNGNFEYKFIFEELSECAGVQLNLPVAKGSQIYSEILDLDADVFIDNEDDLLNISWLRTSDLELSSNQPLFSIVTNSNIDLESTIVSGNYNSEFVYESLDTKNLDLNLFDVSNGFSELKLLQNKPNPFTDITDVEFFIPNQTNVELNITNINGQVVYSKSFGAHAGYNKLQLSKQDLITDSGILILKLKTPDQESRIKMIMIK